MMSRKFYELILACITILGSFHPSLAQDQKMSLSIAPYVNTVFPIFFGLGGKVVVNKQFDLALLYGTMPGSYASVIGSAAANAAENEVYKDAIETLFHENSIWLVEGRYNFQKSFAGPFVKLAYSQVTSSGSSDVNSILEEATGRSFALLSRALALAGRDTEVDIDGSMQVGEIAGGYSWGFGENFFVSFSLGLGRVLSSDVQIKTGLPYFEASDAGSNLIRSGEDGFESILDQYGQSLTLGLSLVGYYP